MREPFTKIIWHPTFGPMAVPDFVDDSGNFVDADFVCGKCGATVNVQFHPSKLENMAEVYKWLDENAPCFCRIPQP